VGDAAGDAASSIAVRMPAAIATIIAVVAVLEMKALIVADTTATAARILPGRSPTAGSPRTAKAKRRSRPWTRIASASMNEPMKRKTSGSEKGRNTSLAGATPATTQAIAPARAVTGSGRASVTHRITTPTRITARLWASGVSGMGG
jgi:hypothetical protein